MGCIVKDRSKYTVINWNVSNIILRTTKTSIEDAEIFDDLELSCIPHLKGTVLMPINNHQHWCLAVADLEKRTFTYLNPSGENKSSIAHYQSSYFLNTLSKYNSYRKTQHLVDGWKIIQMEHPTQKDVYNCGIFVLMFTEKIVKNEPLLFQP